METTIIFDVNNFKGCIESLKEAWSNNENKVFKRFNK
jgi:hypothetical protein